ncbi:hypothetical protein BC829DRAFT_490469 [Chytridium lagenaria]|nr:hypothetical protein BC829DRAFT_490469 [Chytridium lagenaria]
MRSLTPLTNLPPDSALSSSSSPTTSISPSSLNPLLPSPHPPPKPHHRLPPSPRLPLPSDPPSRAQHGRFPETLRTRIPRHSTEIIRGVAEVLTAGREDMMRLHCGDVLKCFGRRENVDLVAFTDCDFNVEEMDEAGVGYI